MVHALTSAPLYPMLGHNAPFFSFELKYHLATLKMHIKHTELVPQLPFSKTFQTQPEKKFDNDS